MTDSKPGHTRIRLRDLTNKKWIIKTGYNHFSEPWTLYTEEVCHNEWDAKFKLIMQDKGKNGFEDGGYYSLVANGVTIRDQRNFDGQKDITSFEGTPPGPAPTDSPTLATPEPTAAPFTPSPSATPSIEPSTTPTTPYPSAEPTTSEPSTTPSAGPTTCDGVVVKFGLLTDDSPEDTSWSIVNFLSGAEVAGGGSYSQSNTWYNEDACLPEACYVFTLEDSDGICCDSGEGQYELEVDGTVLVSDSGEFEGEAYTLFGTCQTA